jgi:hypothetical protein
MIKIAKSVEKKEFSLLQRDFNAHGPVAHFPQASWLSSGKAFAFS